MSTQRDSFPWFRGSDDTIVWIGRLAVPLILLLLWKLSSMVVGPIALAPPGDSFGALFQGFTDGWILTGLKRTLIELAVAYVLAVIAGVWIGVVLGLNRFWEDVTEPFVLGIYSIPKVTLFPIFLFIFQLGLDSKIAFGWFHGVFPILILTMSSMGTIREEHLKVARSLDLSQWQKFREVIVPSILPGLVIGLRLGFNLTFLGIILGEMFAARAGLGYSLMQYMHSALVERMLAIIVLLIFIAAGVNIVFYLIEKRLGSRGDEMANVQM
jgi:NitT/TauT family transport system permease protein